MAIILFISIFSLSALVILYHHFGYPVMLKYLVKKKTSQHIEQKSASLSTKEYPSIALVIPVYNEANAIAEKVRNLAFLDYPLDKLQVHLIFDGCTDHSYELAHQALQEPMCKTLSCELHNESVNRGKLAQLNQLIPNLEADIIALSDVTALLSIDALQIAAGHFANKDVGAVCATYRFLSNGEQQETAYWQYQTAIKLRESLLGSTLGAHGAFYLFRKALFNGLPSDTINDDFILPCQIIKQSQRVIYDDNMVAVEIEPSDLEQDFKRRVRISAGNFQQSIRLSSLLHPKHGITAFMFFSCKWIRPFIPVFFIAALLSSYFMSLESIWFAPCFYGQIGIYFLVLAQHLLKSNNHILIKLHYLVTGHLLSLIGAVKYITGAYNAPWR
ncbi:glycosyltransferase family 2 protein [Marinomonas transparens]|uniref:Glycosyltransferase family 2 protein n=1 Tax=Marinomonas transparens TaxID=2795388 RepID=A0A934N6P7_9GAMM|nr:glycosyltransferase family 2 protein [Marinomonas transparens]MBJ7538256.1 glycosyltransferase family 2 protein [Marinomonas transparens]